MTLSRSGQRRKVDEARAVVRQTLGDSLRRDQPQVEKYVPTARPADPVQVKSEAIGVLTFGEAANRLGISIADMEAMVKRGAMKSLMAGWTVVTRALRSRGCV